MQKTILCVCAKPRCQAVHVTKSGTIPTSYTVLAERKRKICSLVKQIVWSTRWKRTTKPSNSVLLVCPTTTISPSKIHLSSETMVHMQNYLLLRWCEKKPQDRKT